MCCNTISNLTGLAQIFKWEPRKAWDVLLESFLLEFGTHASSLAGADHAAPSPAELILLTKPFHGASNFPEQMHAWAATRPLLQGELCPPRVYVLWEHLRQPDLVALMRGVDAFVLPSRCQPCSAEVVVSLSELHSRQQPWKDTIF